MSRRIVWFILLVLAVVGAVFLPTRLDDEGDVRLGPLAVLAFLLPLMAIVAVLSVAVRRRPAAFRGDMPDPSCARCGYSLRGHTMPAVRCPECGSELSPRDIIVGKDIWRSDLKGRLRRWNLVFLVIVLTSPLYVPGVQRYRRLVRCHEPVSATRSQSGNAHFLVQLELNQARWSLPFGPPIPFSRKWTTIRFRIVGPGAYQVIGVDPADRQFSCGAYHETRRVDVVVPRPLTLADLLDQMKAAGMDTDSDIVKQRAEVTWSYYRAARSESEYVPPVGFLEHSGLTHLGGWGSVRWPEWMAWCLLAVFAVLWFIVAQRIRSRALIEASLAGPHGHSLLRDQTGGAADPPGC